MYFLRACTLIIKLSINDLINDVPLIIYNLY